MLVLKTVWGWFAANPDHIVPLLTACIVATDNILQRRAKKSSAATVTNDVQNTYKVFEETLVVNAQNTKNLCKATQQILDSMPDAVRSLAREVAQLREKIEGLAPTFSGDVH